MDKEYESSVNAKEGDNHKIKKENENEPPETSAIYETLSSEATEKLCENLVTELTVTAPDKESSSAANVMVKEEPYSEEIDYGMPIAKTPVHTSFAESCDPLQNVNENQNVGSNNFSLDKFTSKSALDEYLDGMVTPIAPIVSRLRIKPDLALLKPPQTETTVESNEGEATNSVMIAPPPPNFSSNLDFVTDGIATPRISLASRNRLRVKSEFSLPPATEAPNEDDPPEEFFNNLVNTKNTEEKNAQLSPNVSDEALDNEEIPSDYFDDLLIDKLKEKIYETQNDDLEVKYSDRLKELERLKGELRRIEEKKANKRRKKQKRSKKKSKKRSRSRSLSPPNKAKERRYNDLPNNSYYERNKCSGTSTSREEPSSSIYASRQLSADNLLRVDIKTESDNFTRESLLKNGEKDEEILTPKQKRERVIKRAATLLHYIKHKSDENSSKFSEFPFVSTVRKLPTSHSYVQQQIYENRSPLHRINNVSYKFNSYSSRFKMEEWGLAALPPISAKLAKLVGCDAEFIHNKLKTIKIPAKLMKLKKGPNETAENEDEEELVETASSLYSNAMTQTDDVAEFVGLRKRKGYEIEVQAQPETYSIGCQTLETQSPTRNDLYKNDEMPLMKLVEDFNENQLMAIHAFAELIKQQNTGPNAMEMYKIQMQIMDIYKMSQVPSALDAAQPAILNNYTTRPRGQQENIYIQSVKGADGRQFCLNDPRNRPTAYSPRHVYPNDGPTSSSRVDQRYEQYTSTSTPKGYAQTYSSATREHDTRYAGTSPTPTRHHPYNANTSQSPSTIFKRYGRGGLRR